MSCHPPIISTGACTFGNSCSWSTSDQYASRSAGSALANSSHSRKKATSAPVASSSASRSGRCSKALFSRGEPRRTSIVLASHGSVCAASSVAQARVEYSENESPA
jgi:hypothetical protein